MIEKDKAKYKECYHARKCTGVVWVCSYKKTLKLIVLEVPNLNLLRELEVSQSRPVVVYHEFEHTIYIWYLELREECPLQKTCFSQVTRTTINVGRPFCFWFWLKSGIGKGIEYGASAKGQELCVYPPIVLQECADMRIQHDKLQLDI